MESRRSDQGGGAQFLTVVRAGRARDSGPKSKREKKVQTG